MLNRTKIVFLETDTLGDDVDLTQFQSFGEVVTYPLTLQSEIAERITDADIVIVNKLPMNAKTLSKAAKLRLICLTATGMNNIDFAYTKEKNIAVKNVRGYSTESVVQHTFALLFYLFEKLAYYDGYVKSGDYANAPFFCHIEEKFHELYGKTWGIIGLGEIGRRVAQVAKAFGCRVIYYSTSGLNDNKDFERVDFDTILQSADILSIHAPLNDKTENLIDTAALRKMKPTAYLLNLGRGAIVNQEALAAALTAGEIAGAGLDVLTTEPMSPDNPLISEQDSTKLLITPHIAWATVEARRRCVDEVAKNVAEFLKTERTDYSNSSSVS